MVMMMSKTILMRWMRVALQQARMYRGRCSPNPAVGAVIIDDHGLVSMGAHQRAGESHAEVMALTSAGRRSQGATLFVTLEPCCHTGKTPPCTQAIIQSGISQVYFAYLDPNPCVAGQGQRQLQQAGIACDYLPCQSVEEFYRSYAYWTVHRRPWVTIKLAMTAQGAIAGDNGRPMAITGRKANQLTHARRFHSDAILTSVSTVMADDPQFTARHLNGVLHKPVFVIDPRLQIPLSSRLISMAKPLCVLCGKDTSAMKRKALLARGVVLQEIDVDALGHAQLLDVLRVIGREGYHDVWVEVGAQLFQAFHQQGLVHRSIVYVGQTLSTVDHGCHRVWGYGSGQPTALAWQDIGGDQQLVMDF